MTNLRSREIRLKSRPNGPAADGSHFELATAELSGPGEGQVLVKNLWMSVDPYMRGRMDDVPSYIPPFQIGEALTGHAIGRVIASRSDKFEEGELVFSIFGWRDYYVAPAKEVEKLDPLGQPPQAFLGALGIPGLTAYAGLLKIGEAKAGETVLISAAAGAVGSVACQIAKAIGCKVIAFAGSDAKCDFLYGLGVDHAINYKTAGDLNAAVKKAAPRGIDVYFENVGGAALDAAMANMRGGGRIALCGMISRYDVNRRPPNPFKLINVLVWRLKVQGFIAYDYSDLMPQFRRDMIAWKEAGKMRFEETVVNGIENAPRAFFGLFKGENTGKMLVKLSDDDDGGGAAASTYRPEAV